MELLNSINDCDLGGHNISCEVCISDNASNDGTEDLIRDISNFEFPIKYNRQLENKGADQNYLNVASMASGEYIWFMGSDDQLEPNAILELYNSFSSNADIYLIGRKNYDINMSHEKSIQFFNDKKYFHFKSQDDVLDYLNSCLSIGGVFSYLSADIVKKDMWNSHLGGVEELIGSLYAHVYVMCEVAFSSGSIDSTGKALVKNRQGNDSFAGSGAVSRLLIDIEGYIKLAKHIPSIKKSKFLQENFLKILTKEINLYQICLYLRAHATKTEWQRSKEALLQLKIPAIYLHIIDCAPFIAKIIYWNPLKSFIKDKFY
jgi:abequosyltransferase